MADPEERCPSCGEPGVQWRDAQHEIIHGVGKEAVWLKVMVPVGKCSVCEYEFIGEAAQIKAHDAVCRHLGVLTPSEVREVREQRGLSHAQLAHELGVDEARVKRWERGAGVQSVEHDALLRKWPNFMGPDVSPAGAFQVGDFIWLAEEIGKPVVMEWGTMTSRTRAKAFRVVKTRIEDGTVTLDLVDCDARPRTAELWGVQDFHITKGSA